MYQNYQNRHYVHYYQLSFYVSNPLESNIPLAVGCVFVGDLRCKCPVGEFVLAEDGRSTLESPHHSREPLLQHFIRLVS